MKDIKFEIKMLDVYMNEFFDEFIKDRSKMIFKEDLIY
jgi:hypothetical protein